MRLERISVAVTIILLAALPGCAAENDGSRVLSAALNRIMKYNRDGVLQYFWGTYGLNWQGGLARPHQIDVDEDGTLYVASYDGGWVNKFVPKPGADPSKLIGRPLILGTE